MNLEENMGLDHQAAKPSGIIGTLIGRLMNRVHGSVYRDYFKTHLPADGAAILDLGCGGGQLIR